MAAPPPAAPPPTVVETTTSTTTTTVAVPTPAPAPAAPVAAAAPAWNTVMKEELLVDSYYMYNFSGANSLVPPAGRNYDQLSNSFTLSYAKVALEVDADPITVRADLGYGTLASLISGGSPGSGTSAFAAQQAYASLKVPGTQLSIDMGRFNTTAGAEVIEANRNWNYSRSLLFSIIPVTHTGLRLNYKINDMISVQGSVVNGIANDQPDNNSDKTYGLSISAAPLPTTSVILTGYFGKEANEGVDPNPVRTTIDLVVAQTINDMFGLNLNIDYVKLDAANAIGASLMGRYVVAEHLSLAARGEFLHDKGILLGGTSATTAVNLFEGTLTAGVPFAGHFEARAELRGDFAGDAIFPEGTAAAPDPKKQQFTGTVAFLGFI